MTKLIVAINALSSALIFMFAVSSFAVTKPIDSFKILHASETESKGDDRIKFYGSAAQLKTLLAKQDVGGGVILYSTRMEYRNRLEHSSGY